MFFKTNMERTEQRDGSIIYNLHIQLKHWQGGFAGKGRIKIATQRSGKHPEADQTDVKERALRGSRFSLEGGGGVTASEQVWAEGSHHGTTLEWYGTEWKSHDGRRFPLIDRHPGEATHTTTDSITDLNSFLVRFIYVCLYFLSSFIRKCFIARVVWGDRSASRL